MDPLRVTVVGHDASRTGAPIALASLLRWLHGEGVSGVRLILERGGPLLAEYRRTTPTRVARLGDSSRLGQMARAVESLAPARRSGHHLVSARLGLVGERTPDVVVANTLAALSTARTLARPLRGPGARLICHVHELDGVARRVLPRDAASRRSLIGTVDHFIAAGRDVGTMLTERFAVAPGRVTTLDGFIERPGTSAEAIARARRQLTTDEGRPIVLAVGAMHRRKGPERFVDLVGALAGRPDRPLGAWLGGDARGVVREETVGDVRRSAAASSIRLVPAESDPFGYMAAADVVVSTAIEDPFPLSVLEAGALGVPVVGFDSGGISAVLGASGLSEHLCPIGDTLALARVVSELIDDPERRRRAGRQLCDRVISSHLVEHAAPIWWAAVVG